jgi:streptomycin 6-kinase
MAITQEKFESGLKKLQLAKQNWKLTDDGDAFTTGLSLLQPVIYEDQPAMLKIPLGSKEQGGFRLMACWNGNAAAKVFQYDAEALLMERAIGKSSLKQMVFDGNEDQANAIIIDVVRRLHTNTCGHVSGLVPLSILFRSLRTAAEHNGGIFSACHETAENLLSNPLNSLVLHGDIHYDNILDSGSRGWIAIDPKGFVGESSFDLANIFCNPDIRIAGSKARLSKQVRWIAELAHVEIKRLLQWIIAWSGLMASWMLEDKEDVQLPIIVGELAIKELSNCQTD